MREESNFALAYIAGQLMDRSIPRHVVLFVRIVLLLENTKLAMNDHIIKY